MQRSFPSATPPKTSLLSLLSLLSSISTIDPPILTVTLHDNTILSGVFQHVDTHSGELTLLSNNPTPTPITIPGPSILFINFPSSLSSSELEKSASEALKRKEVVRIRQQRNIIRKKR